MQGRWRIASSDTGVGRWAPQADFPFGTLAELGLDVDQLEAERAYAIALAAERAWQQAQRTTRAQPAGQRRRTKRDAAAAMLDGTATDAPT